MTVVTRRISYSSNLMKTIFLTIAKTISRVRVTLIQHIHSDSESISRIAIRTFLQPVFTRARIYTRIVHNIASTLTFKCQHPCTWLILNKNFLCLRAVKQPTNPKPGPPMKEMYCIYCLIFKYKILYIHRNKRVEYLPRSLSIAFLHFETPSAIGML